jgi:hypothetical protein
MKTLNIVDIRPEIKTCVSTYLLARVLAECEREKIDAIETEILETANYWTAKKWTDKHGISQCRVLAPKETYLMDEAEYKDYRAECVKRMIAAGYSDKEYRLSEGFCPALIAESMLCDAKHALIKATQAIFPDISAHKLLCHYPGVETMNKYVDLWVGLVVNLPDFENPLKKLGKVA